MTAEKVGLTNHDNEEKVEDHEFRQRGVLKRVRERERRGGAV